MGQQPAKHAEGDWWTEERDSKARRAVLTFVRKIPLSAAVDAIGILTNGRQFLVLVGETHAPTDWNPVPDVRALRGELGADRVSVYIEQPSTRHGEHGEAWTPGTTAAQMCTRSDSPVSKVCRANLGARKIDPRPPVLYDFIEHLNDLREAECTLPPSVLTNLYWDILTLFYDLVRATVKANIVRTAPAGNWDLVLMSQMQSFRDGVRAIRARIRQITDREQFAAFVEDSSNWAYPLTEGVDLIFLSDVAYRNVQVNVYFAGSAHVRRLMEELGKFETFHEVFKEEYPTAAAAAD